MRSSCSPLETVGEEEKIISIACIVCLFDADHQQLSTPLRQHSELALELPLAGSCILPRSIPLSSLDTSQAQSRRYTARCEVCCAPLEEHSRQAAERLCASEKSPYSPSPGNPLTDDLTRVAKSMRETHAGGLHRLFNTDIPDRRRAALSIH